MGDGAVGALKDGTDINSVRALLTRGGETIPTDFRGTLRLKGRKVILASRRRFLAGVFAAKNWRDRIRWLSRARFLSGVLHGHALRSPGDRDPGSGTHVAELGLQAELEQMLRHACQT